MPTSRYPPVAFDAPIADRYLYAGWSVDPPARVPIVRRSDRRRAVIERCRVLARESEDRDGVTSATVFETELIPPLDGVPRLDVLMLTRATTPEALARVRDDVARLEPDLVTEARNIRRIGDTERTRSATFLFNHFTAPNPVDAVTAWEKLAAWYTTQLGVDNTTLLAPVDTPDQTAPYALVNYVRVPQGARRFLFTQLVRPSFHTYVRPMLRDNGMVALPLLGRPVS